MRVRVRVNMSARIHKRQLRAKDHAEVFANLFQTLILRMQNYACLQVIFFCQHHHTNTDTTPTPWALTPTTPAHRRTQNLTRKLSQNSNNIDVPS